ncbi:HK97 gp10 family phage protein [Paenalkalicoccus suaedae]|uniref:HK97 gp10 family phage protein n=1 Tax=Paenalkalicoccus suaedae TaxID=2592382 RepID=A0A859FI82_9BACI|nr:HK97-gp10 family putative phage morphogenesis protein [Paenalkalicoccus suaedae]QKS71906.1 HK97 gp10 family phage protein [Paenalkalicoccus suaedae]
MKSQMKVEGLDKLQKELEKLAKKVDDSETESIVYKAAESIVTPAIQSKAPVGEGGSIRDAVVTKQMPRSSSYPSIAISAIDRKKAPHAHIIELGSGPRFDNFGRYRGEVSPNPFFRQAVSQSLPSALNFIKSELTKRING